MRNGSHSSSHDLGSVNGLLGIAMLVGSPILLIAHISGVLRGSLRFDAGFAIAMLVSLLTGSMVLYHAWIRVVPAERVRRA